jgi:predicted permease
LFTIKPQVELYTPRQIQRMTAELVRRISPLPGVRSVAIAEEGPLGSRGSSSAMIRVRAGNPIRAMTDEATPGFFETIGMPRLAGRDFSPSDKEDSPLVVILNDVLARALFNENPIGRTVVVDGREPRQFQIIGIMRASRYNNLHDPPPPAAYFAIQQLTAYMPTLHVRVDGRRKDADVVAAVRHELDVLDKDVPVFSVKSLEDRIDDSLSSERMVSALAGAFGVLALLLASVGLYGLMAYLVTCRTREIGIRMALGSSARSVLWLVLKEALMLLALGIAGGMAAGMIAARLIANQLFGLSSSDPITMLGAAVIMLLVTGIAICIPVSRALRVDPARALRYE